MQTTVATIERSVKLPGLRGEKTHARRAAKAVRAAIEAIEADGCKVFDYTIAFSNNADGEVIGSVETIYFTTREGREYFCYGMLNYLNDSVYPYS